MAETPEGKIAELLRIRITALAITLQMPLSLNGYNFTPPTNRKYFRVQHIPNVVERQHINSDGPHRYMGILQVSVHWEKNRGETEPREMAGRVVSHFPCDLILRDGDLTVRIMKRPVAADLLPGDVDVQIPVSIEYEAYA